MKGPGTIFETEFASVVALPRVPRRRENAFCSFSGSTLGRVSELLLFLGAQFERGSRWSSKMERSILRCILCCKRILDRFYSTWRNYRKGRFLSAYSI